MIHARGEDALQNSIRLRHPFGYLSSETLVGDGTQLLIGFGPRPHCDPADRAAMQASLDAILPGYEVVDATAHDWFADEYSRGTWAIHRPGWYEHHHAAMRRPEGNVILAGSDLANGWAGFIDGAIEPGAPARGPGLPPSAATIRPCPSTATRPIWTRTSRPCGGSSRPRTRFPEWWPRVIEVEGERFEEGDEYAQVTKDPTRKEVRTNFLIEKRDEMREIRMKCDLTGAYADWVLTPAQGGTFVELEMGMQANWLSDRLMDMAIGRHLLPALEPGIARGARRGGGALAPAPTRVRG